LTRSVVSLAIPAPRSRWAGASWLRVLAVLLGTGVRPLGAQEPPDTIAPPDTVARPADTAQVVADSARALPDSLEADSTVAIDTFPRFSGPRDHGYGAGVWEWTREELLSNRAFTLTELLSQIPGVIALRGGDFGAPTTVLGFGAAAGRIRVFLDGFEMTALETSTLDLSRLGLAALERVRAERLGTGLRVELETHQPLDPSPTTLIEVGTGDLRTDLLRGDFAHPNALGGSLTFSFDRLDTQGPGLEESGSHSGFGLRYGIHRGNRGGIVFSLRRYTAESDLDLYLPSTTRGDWHLRGRWALTPELMVDAFWGGSSYQVNVEADTFELSVSRRQAGLRVGWESGSVWSSAAGRFFELGDGEGLPDFTLEGRTGVRVPELLTAEGRFTRESWADESTTSYAVRATSRPVFGFRAFGSYADDRRGLPFAGGLERFRRDVMVRDSLQSVSDTAQTPPAVPDAPVMPALRITDRTSYRLGGSVDWRGIHASGAYLKVVADSLHPTGLQFDGGGPVLEGGERTGYEVALGLPLGKGFRIDAAYQKWQEDWPYMPAATWDGQVAYHGVFKESGNLEVWGRVGVNGRDPMRLRLLDPTPETVPEDGSPALQSVPFYQDWYGFVQVRIVTVSIFVRWENIAGKEDNMDIPGRTLPRFRTLFGVRWAMRN